MAVVEDVAEVGAAIVAEDFVAHHAVAGIGLGVDRIILGSVKAGPAAAAVELFL